jgi:hypothetical protein
VPMKPTIKAVVEAEEVFDCTNLSISVTLLSN